MENFNHFQCSLSHLCRRTHKILRFSSKLTEEFNFIYLFILFHRECNTVIGCHRSTNHRRRVWQSCHFVLLCVIAQMTLDECTSWRQTIVMCFVCMSHSVHMYAATGNSKAKCETKTKRRREKTAPHLVACRFDLYEIFFVVAVARCYCGLSAIITSSNGHYYKYYLSSYDRCVCSDSFCVNKSCNCQKANDGNGNRRLGWILNSYSLLLESWRGHFGLFKFAMYAFLFSSFVLDEFGLIK